MPARTRAIWTSVYYVSSSFLTSVHTPISHDSGTAYHVLWLKYWTLNHIQDASPTPNRVSALKMETSQWLLFSILLTVLCIMIELKLEQNQNKQKQGTQGKPWEVELVHVARVRIHIHILLFLSLCRETLPWLLKFSLLVKKIGSYLM